MFRIIFFIGLLSFFSAPLTALAEGNVASQFYNQGQYLEALSAYQQLCNQQGGSADIYYNIGLCYLRISHQAEAKLNFERALLYYPASKKIKSQLSHINQKIEPKIEALPPFFLYGWFTSIRNALNKSEWGWIVLALSITLGISGIIQFLLKRQLSGYVNKFLFVFFGICLLFYLSRQLFEKSARGILMDSNVLKIAPASSAQELLPLGSGTSIKVIDSLQEWYKVQLENNDQGWLLKEHIQKI